LIFDKECLGYICICKAINGADDKAFLELLDIVDVATVSEYAVFAVVAVSGVDVVIIIKDIESKDIFRGDY